MKRRLASALVVVASLLVAGARMLDRGAASAPGPPAPQAQQPREAGAPRPAPPQPDPRRSTPGAVLKTLGDPSLDAQVAAVVDSMASTGRPPEGVAQGGRRGGPRGLFDNAQGSLPRQARGYYTETDVWPKHGDRGVVRLVLGRGGEVYYSDDHYRTFTRLR